MARGRLTSGYLSFHITGMEGILNSKQWQTGISQELDELTQQIAEHGRDVIKIIYESGVNPANHPFTHIINLQGRGVGGGEDNPLHKSGGLADAVMWRKIGKADYEVLIKPGAEATGSTRASLPYSQIASLQETGYTIPVTTQVKAFWKYYSQFDPRVSPNLTAPYLVVPARPVWDPASEYLKAIYAKEMKTLIHSALLFHGIYKKGNIKYEKNGIQLYSLKRNRFRDMPGLRSSALRARRVSRRTYRELGKSHYKAAHI